MPDIGRVMKQEISRLARKEMRGEIQALKKVNARQRGQIAGLKNEIGNLQRQVSQFQRRLPATPPASEASADGQHRRLGAHNIKSQRKRLGLSAGDFGKLVGVSAQTVYNWEAGQVRPNAKRAVTIVSLRNVGRREANARLAALAERSTAKKKPSHRKRGASR